MDYSALAKQYGAVQQTQPKPAQQGPEWINQLSPKDQAEINMKLYQESRKRLSDLDTYISKSQPMMQDLQKFGELNRQTPTGSLWDNIAPSWPILHGEDTIEMNAIQSRNGPSQRVEGSGSSSDRDVSLFMRGIPSINNPGNVNKGIREDFERRYNYAIDKRNAMQNYINQYGNLNGFDEQWASKQKPTQTNPTTPNRRATDKPQGGVKFLGFE